jgi:hypothetical protein
MIVHRGSDRPFEEHEALSGGRATTAPSRKCRWRTDLVRAPLLSGICRVTQKTESVVVNRPNTRDLKCVD